MIQLCFQPVGLFINILNIQFAIQINNFFKPLCLYDVKPILVIFVSA